MNRPAFDLERQSDDGPLSYRRGRPRAHNAVLGKAAADGTGVFGAPQTTAEAELYAYLNEGHAPFQSGFPPIQELTSRLGEFSFDRRTSRLTPADAKGESDEDHGVPDDETARLARAATEIFHAAQSMERTRLDLHALAASTREEIVTTVKSTALQAAAVAVKRVEAAAKQAFTNNFTQLDANIRDLQAQTTKAHNLTSQALSQMDATLNKVLKQTESAFHPKESANGRPRRHGIHIPVNAGPRTFAPSMTRRFTATMPKASLTDIGGRPRGPEPAAEATGAGDGVRVKRQPPAFLRALKTEPEHVPQPAEELKRPERDEAISFPVIGIAIVAFVMLLASAALYVLHTRGETPGFSALRATPSRTVAGPGAPPSVLQTLDSEPAFAKEPSSFQAAAPGIDTPNADDIRRVFAAAQQGDAEAQFRTGMRLLNSAADPASGARWLMRAAARDHPQALFALASLFERGVGVGRDERQASALYRRAAEKGDTRAMHNLAVLLHENSGANADVEAAKWFARAASSGITASQYNLGLFYELGFGVKADIDKAYFWYSIAAAAGDDDAKLQADRVADAVSPSAKTLALENVKLWRPSP